MFWKRRGSSRRWFEKTACRKLEVAELLGRHKTWVCRRLALLEKLAPQARQDLQLGLLSVTAARELLRLPHGNQLELLECLRRESLTTGEIREVVDLLLACEHARAAGVRFGKASAGDFAGSRRSDSQLGSAAEHGGQPCGSQAGLAVGQPVADGELVATHRPRRTLAV